MPLYKYVTAERIDVLENELIRFTQPSALNDPWEMRPHVERLITDNDLESIATPLTQQSDEELIDYISEILKNISKTYNLGDKSLDEIRKVVVESNKEFPNELRQLYEGALAEGLEVMKAALPAAVEHVPDALDKSLGILSLTERPDHPLMWSHYAENHSGIVLEFDESHAFFRSPRAGEPDDFGSLRMVKYDAERPRLDPLIDMSWVDNLTPENAMSWADKLFFTKSQEWSYEKEWRMIKGLKKADKVIPTSNGSVYLFSVPAKCILSVILGQRMTLETRQQVIEFVRTDEKYAGVSLFQARSSTDKFAIEIQPL